MAETTLYNAIRDGKPGRLRISLRDGTARDYAMPGGKKRTAMAVKAVEVLPWIKVEMFDAQSNYLGAIEPDDSPAAPAPPQYMKAENELADIMIRCQQAATAGFKDAYAPILEANRVMLDLMLARVVRMEEKFAEMMDFVHAAAKHISPEKTEQGTLDHLAGKALEAAMPGILRKVGIEVPGNGGQAPQIPADTGPDV